MVKLVHIPLVISVCSFSASKVLPRGSPTLRTLHPRQSDSTIDPSDIPSQCQSVCSGIISTSNNCQSSTSLSCGCSVSDLNEFEGCLSCLVALAPSGASGAQESLDQYVEACDAAGVSLPSGTLSGVVSATAPVASNTRVNTRSSIGETVIFTATPSITDLTPTISDNSAFTTNDDSGNDFQTPTSSSRASASATSSGANGNGGPLSGFNSAASRAQEGNWAISVVLSFMMLVILA